MSVAFLADWLKLHPYLQEEKRSLPILVKELFSEDEIRQHIVDKVVTELDDECSQICTHSKPAVFRQVPTTYMEEFKWTNFIQELQTRAPNLLRMLL